MKTTLIFILLIISFSTSYSQTKLKPAPLSTLSYLGKTISLDDTSVWAPRVQKHFMLGWQWAGPNINTNKRLHCNFYQSHFGQNSISREYFANIPDTGEANYIVWQHLQYLPSIGDWFLAMGNQRGFQFEPTGLTALNFNNSTRAGDTTGGVYGFGVRDTVYGHLNSSGADFDRYLFLTSSFPESSHGEG